MTDMSHTLYDYRDDESLEASILSSAMSTYRGSLGGHDQSLTEESTKASLERGTPRTAVSPLPIAEMKLQARLCAVEQAVERRCTALENKVNVLARTAVRDTANFQKQLQEQQEQLEATTYLLQAYHDKEARKMADLSDCLRDSSDKQVSLQENINDLWYQLKSWCSKYQNLADTVEPELRGLQSKLDKRCTELGSMLLLSGPGMESVGPTRETGRTTAALKDAITPATLSSSGSLESLARASLALEEVGRSASSPAATFNSFGDLDGGPRRHVTSTPLGPIREASGPNSGPEDMLAPPAPLTAASPSRLAGGQSADDVARSSSSPPVTVSSFAHLDGVHRRHVAGSPPADPGSRDARATTRSPSPLQSGLQHPAQAPDPCAAQPGARHTVRGPPLHAGRVLPPTHRQPQAPQPQPHVYSETVHRRTSAMVPAGVHSPQTADPRSGYSVRAPPQARSFQELPRAPGVPSRIVRGHP